MTSDWRTILKWPEPKTPEDLILIMSARSTTLVDIADAIVIRVHLNGKTITVDRAYQIARKLVLALPK